MGAKPTPRTVNNSFTIGKPTLNRRRGTAGLPVTIPGAGAVAVKGAKPTRREASVAGKLVLRIVPKRSQRSLLAKKGALRLRLLVTFSPSGGTANSRAVVVKLRKQSQPG